MLRGNKFEQFLLYLVGLFLLFGVVIWLIGNFVDLSEAGAGFYAFIFYQYLSLVLAYAGTPIALIGIIIGVIRILKQKEKSLPILIIVLSLFLGGSAITIYLNNILRIDYSDITNFYFSSIDFESDESCRATCIEAGFSEGACFLPHGFRLSQVTTDRKIVVEGLKSWPTRKMVDEEKITTLGRCAIEDIGDRGNDCTCWKP